MSKTTPTTTELKDTIKNNTASTPSQYEAKERILPGWKLEDTDVINGYTIYDLSYQAGVHLMIPAIKVILKNVPVVSNQLMGANPYKPHQKFHVTIPVDVYEDLTMKPGHVTLPSLQKITAVPILEDDDIVDEIPAERPGSMLGEFLNMSDDKPSYTQSAQQMRATCPWNPARTISGYIQQLKKASPEKLRLLPTERDYKTNRLGMNIYDGPVAEITKRGIFLKTNGSTGIQINDKSTSISGTMIRDSNEDILPQQATGIPTRPYPMDDFIPQGTILLPQTKRSPAILEVILSMLPILEAVRVAISLAKLIKK